MLDLRHAREATRALESATAALAAVGFATSAARIVGESEPAESEDTHRAALEQVEPTVPISAERPDEILDVPTVSATSQVGTVARRSQLWLAGTVVLVIVLATVLAGLMYAVVLYLRA